MHFKYNLVYLFFIRAYLEKQHIVKQVMEI